MKFHSLTRYAFAFLCAVLLANCGGGGAESRVVDTGTFAINPPTATWFAFTKNTFVISGGTGPFTLTSSEPALLPLPLNTSDRTIDVVPNQPGVVDAGLQPNELQVRTVNVTVRSAIGETATAVIKVAQNFLTGYGMVALSSTCAAGAGVVCAGGETALFFDSTFAGNLYAGHQFRIERVRGPFQFVDPLNSNNQVDAVTVTADHEGKFTTIIRVASGVPSQVAVLKVTDLATGAFTFRTFTISSIPATGALTAIPATISLTGPNATFCGSGTVDVLVFDGQTPYTMVCPNPQIQVLNGVSTSQPGRFTLNIGASAGACLTGEQCVITDNTGRRTTVTVTTVKGTDPPLPALAVSPTALTLVCGGSGSVTVIGGTGTYQASSSHQRVTAVVSGNTVTVTRLTGDATGLPGQSPPFAPFPTTATISITDGRTITPVTVTVPDTCT